MAFLVLSRQGPSGAKPWLEGKLGQGDAGQVGGGPGQLGHGRLPCGQEQGRAGIPTVFYMSDFPRDIRVTRQLLEAARDSSKSYTYTYSLSD